MQTTNLRPGYVSVLAVLSLTSVMLVMLASSFRFSLQSQEVQKAAQLRIDYTNREQTLLRGTLNEVVNSSIRSMKADTNSSDWQNGLRWRWIFENARALADGETALDDSVATVIGVKTTAISGNLGDGGEDHIINNITATIDQASTHMFYVNSGTNNTATSLGTGYPEPLVFNDPSLELLDRDRPIIAMAKTYGDGSQYKLIPYPNVHFGYTTQGQNFVAKRNWWAFTVTYGKTSKNQTGVQTVEKDYVLSIYEVPSQLAISSTSVTYLGNHADGSSWGDVSISGGVFANKAFAENIALDLVSTRRGSSLDGATVGAVKEDTFSGELPSREKFEAETNTFYPISTAGDSGLVAFVPITQGVDTFDDLSNTDDSNRGSPTSWNWYSRPAMQCAMKVRVEDVVSASDQTPTRISFTYKAGGIDTTEYFTRGVNWPTEDSTEGAAFPFHLEDTNSSRPGVAVYVSRLADYLTSVSADSLEVNNSLLVNSNYVDNVDVTKPSIPSLPTDPSLIFRDAKDLTRFTKGFSLVTPYRLYLANDVNLTASGTDASGNEIYPPISLFAPEKRFGVREQAINIDFEGQLNYVGATSDTTIRPLDLRSGVEEKVVSENIKARLYGISDPAQLPPINQMNWLVVIEEVR